MNPSDFLRLLWGAAPPGQALVWRLPGKQSTWFRNWDNVDKFCEAHKRDCDIYTGVSLINATSNGVGAYTRTSSTNAAAIAGLWADIDIVSPYHKKANLPPTAEAVILELWPRPTLIIHSGHGLQVWWLFDKPWVFADAGERQQAQQLTQWWHWRLSKHFVKKGWALDATHDLARVMRLPGTINHKAEHPDRDGHSGATPVVMLSSQPQTRLDRGELMVGADCFRVQTPRLAVERPFGELCPPVPGERAHPIQDAHLELNPAGRIDLQPDAMPPLARFEALAAISEKFMRSWLHQRRDLPDQSASAYDLSLASIAVQAEWGDQEIANLLIAHRRERGEDLKLREDYYQRTIMRAKLGWKWQ